MKDDCDTTPVWGQPWKSHITTIMVIFILLPDDAAHISLDLSTAPLTKIGKLSWRLSRLDPNAMALNYCDVIKWSGTESGFISQADYFHASPCGE